MSRFSTEPQNFACSRRALPGKLFAIAGAMLLPERRSEISVTPTEVQPEFKVGDLVAEDYADEFDKNATDFGEVRGMSYVPNSISGCSPNTWVYYVYWTRTTSGCDSSYPCYDDTQPVTRDRLRLINHR